MQNNYTNTNVKFDCSIFHLIKVGQWHIFGLLAFEYLLKKKKNIPQYFT